MADEHDIEEQLRAYADQRRKEAGAPFTMHPATRRMLQAEAARVHGKKPSVPPGKTSLFAALWFRVAASVCVVAILAVAVFAPSLSKSKSKVMRLAGKQEQDKMETGDFGRSRTPAPARETTPPPAASPATVAYKMDAHKNKSGSPEETVRNPSAAQPETAAATKSFTPPGIATGATTLAFNAPVQQQNFRNEIAPAATGVAAGRGLGGKQGGTDLEKSLDRRSKTVAEKIPLAAFQFEQTGNQIRITDSDGSVYHGNLTTPGAQTAAGSAGGAWASLPPATTMEMETPRQQVALEDKKTAITNVVPRPAGQVLPGGRPEGKTPAIASVVRQQNQNFQFNAIGTNLSLNQKIVINGEFVAATNQAMDSGRAMPIGQLNGQATRNDLQLLSNGRITGRALLGNGQEIRLNAAPVAP